MHDSGWFRDATPEQLQVVLDYLDTPLFNDFLLDAYLEWANGIRAFSAGNEFAVDGFREQEKVQWRWEPR